MDTTAVVVLVGLVAVCLALTVVLIVRERRAAALARRLDAASGTDDEMRAAADARRQGEPARGEAGGLSQAAAGHNSPSF